jgi:PhzF family phenazine biosynthesis protein
MSLTITQVDAFTNRAFAGNPAAVCILPESRDDLWLQQVAREMNLSETAFLLAQEDGYRLRWFTPTVEVDLCGHATLASAHVLWESGRLGPNDEARFYTRSGLLTARRQGEWIELDFPAEPPQPAAIPPEVSQALGLTAPSYVGKNRFDYLVEVAGEAEVRALQPNFSQLKSAGGRGVIVTSRSDSAPYDFVSRFFAPAAGIDEDPVTGSAHCCLGPYWAGKLGQSTFLAYQASARGGEVRVQLKGERVLLGGQAVTVLRGELI